MSEMVLAQMAVPDKESEITNIPQLLSYLDITGSTITVDALNTRTKDVQDPKEGRQEDISRTRRTCLPIGRVPL